MNNVTESDQNQWDAWFGILFQALIESLEEKNGGPFAAGVIRDTSLISVGTNRVIRSLDVSRHAEIEALDKAGKKLGRFDLSGSWLLTTHFPCLMCYHAVKWARIRKVFYLFDYDETARLFSFHGDNSLLKDLGLSYEAFEEDPSLELVRYSSPEIKRLFFGDLVNRWKGEFQKELNDYDLPR